MTLPNTQGMATLAGQAAHYAAVRARLFGRNVVVEVPPAPTAPAARRAIEPIRPEPEDTAPLNMLKPCHWRFLVKLAAVRHEVSEADVRSDSRKRLFVAARTEAMALVYQHTQASMPAVGHLFGRDHTTVLHALRKAGSTGKLVEVLPHMSAATRLKIQGKVERPEAITPKAKAANAVQRVVRAGYRARKHTEDIAAEAGISPASVKVIACRLGLRRADFPPPPKSKLDWEARA